MARQRKRYAASDISAVWTAPESLQAKRVQDAVDRGASAQEVADVAMSSGKGEYREYLGEEVIENVSHPKLGELLVWCHPDGEDAGWYEHFTGDPADYEPVVTATEEG